MTPIYIGTAKDGKEDSQPAKKQKNWQKAKSRSLHVPVDDLCGLFGSDFYLLHVYRFILTLTCFKDLTAFTLMTTIQYTMLL